MSLRRILETLGGLGLSQSDARVYVFLAKEGPHTSKDLCVALSLQKPQLYPCLKNLQRTGLVNAAPQRPALFSAVSFDRVLDLLVQDKMEEAQRTQREKEKALRFWQSMMNENTEE